MPLLASSAETNVVRAIAQAAATRLRPVVVEPPLVAVGVVKLPVVVVDVVKPPVVVVDAVKLPVVVVVAAVVVVLRWSPRP